MNNKHVASSCDCPGRRAGLVSRRQMLAASANGFGLLDRKTMIAETTRLTAGSSQFQPVTRMRPPETTTPAEMAASATICR